MHLWGWLAAVIVPLATTLLLAEVTELSPWLARKVVKAGAHLLLERNQVSRYEAEWMALLPETPGKLTVLIRAIGIVLLAVPRLNWDYYDCVWCCTIGLRSFTSNIHRQLKWPWYEQFDDQCRSTAREYNSALSEACRALRDGSPTERAEALNLLEELVEDPPPWVSRYPSLAFMMKWGIGRDLPHFRQSLRRRGLLAT